MDKNYNTEITNEKLNNNFNIDLLDTLDKNNLFNNIIPNDNHNDSQTDNFQLNEQDIDTPKSDQGVTEENQTIKKINEIEEKNENIFIENNNEEKNLNLNNIDDTDNDNKSFESNKKDNNNNNCFDFNDFISKIKNKNNTKIDTKKDSVSKSHSPIQKNKINNNSIVIQKHDRDFSKNKKSKNEINKEEKTQKKKYSKERMEINKQRLNNLYNDYKKFKTKIENMKNDLSKEEMKDCSFTPQINKYSKKLVKNNSNYSKPIYLRNNENKKEFYKKKYELNFTHMPKINKNYKCNLDIYARLYNKNPENKDNYLDGNNCQFRPITNYNYEKAQISNNIKNISKRKKLLNDYINHQKIALNNSNKENKIPHTPNTSCTSISKVSIKKEKQKIFRPYFNKITKTMFKPNKPSLSLIYRKTNIYNDINERNYKLNNTYIQQYRNKKIEKNKSMNTNKSFLLDYMNNNYIKINNQKQKKKTPNNLKKNDINNIFYKNQYITEKKINSNNEKENVVLNYINKINLKDNESLNKGICVDIAKRCKIIKKIVQKNKKINPKKFNF